MARKTSRLVLCALAGASILAVVMAIWIRASAGVLMYDANFQTFDETLSEQERRGIMSSLDAVTAVLLWTIVVSNGLWCIWAIVVASRINHRR